MGARMDAFRSYYDGINRQLNDSTLADVSVFLNFGYIADDSAQRAAHEVPRHYLNRNSAKLVLERKLFRTES